MINRPKIPQAVSLSQRAVDDLNTLSLYNSYSLQMIIKSYLRYLQGHKSVFGDKVKFNDFKPYSVVDKSKRNEKLTKLVSLRLSRTDYMALRKIARANKIYSVQELIRQIVDYYFAWLQANNKKGRN